jgi:hypothetical protein
MFYEIRSWKDLEDKAEEIGEDDHVVFLVNGRELCFELRANRMLIPILKRSRGGGKCQRTTGGAPS